MDGLKLAEDAVHDPVDRCSADRCGGAGIYALQMPNDRSDDRQLHIRRIGNNNAARSRIVDELNRIIVVNTEGEDTLVANDRNTVSLSTLMPYKAPGGTTGDTTVEDESSRNRVFGLIKMLTVRRITVGTHDCPEKLLEQIELMRCQIIKIATTRDVWL